jgi:hypothetical protein
MMRVTFGIDQFQAAAESIAPIAPLSAVAIIHVAHGHLQLFRNAVHNVVVRRS